MTKSTSLIIWPYGYYLDVVVTDDIPAAHAARAEAIGHDLDGDAEALHSSSTPAFKSWLFYKPGASAGQIAHEAHHCICKLWRVIGAKDVHEEIHAYTLHWLTNKVSRILEKHKPALP